MPDGLGNSEQVRAIADQVGLAAAHRAIREFVSQYPNFAPPPPKPESPSYVKWGAGIGATLVAAAILWMANTLNQLQLTVARIDERQLHDTTSKRLDVVEQNGAKLSERVTKLEEKVK